MHTLFRRLAIVVAVCGLGAAAHADLKITTKNTMMGNTTEGTTYVKGARQRSEMQMGPMHQVTITQCDKRQTITISDACRTYMVAPMDPEEAGEAAEAAPPPSASSGGTRKGGTLTIHTSTTNTGETKRMFGYTARHIKSSMSMTSSPDACNPNNMKMEADGWYADFSGGGMTCSSPARPTGGMGRMRPDCQDRIRYTGSGMRRLGYPMDVTTTITDDRGNTFSTRQETTELSQATLDPALFEVPAGYKKVDSYQGLMCQAAMSGMGAPPPPSSNSTATDLSRHRRGGSGALCVAPVENRTATALDNEAWRDTLISELETMRIDTVKLEARNQFDLEDEARAKGCRVVLYSDVTELKQPSSGRRLGKVLGAGVSANYQAGIQVELMPMDDFTPWLDKGVSGRGESLDASGEDAFGAEAQEVATELSKPH